jgi:hypothetical protein
MNGARGHSRVNQRGAATMQAAAASNFLVQAILRGNVKFVLLFAAVFSLLCLTLDGNFDNRHTRLKMSDHIMGAQISFGPLAQQ